MRKLLLSILVLTILTIGANAQAFQPLVQLTGRVFVYPNYSIFQSEYRRLFDFFQGDQYRAATLANGTMHVDAENRLSDALDQIRARDPFWFDTVFQQHGLVLKKIGEE